MTIPGKVQPGDIQVHRKVIEEIVFNAARDTEGVRLGKKGFWPFVKRLLTAKRYPGIHVRMDKSGKVRISMDVLVRFGLNIPNVARQLQDSVRASIDQTTDLDVKDINVNVQGVSREV